MYNFDNEIKKKSNIHSVFWYRIIQNDVTHFKTMFCFSHLWSIVSLRSNPATEGNVDESEDCRLKRPVFGGKGKIVQNSSS